MPKKFRDFLKWHALLEQVHSESVAEPMRLHPSAVIQPGGFERRRDIVLRPILSDALWLTLPGPEKVSRISVKHLEQLFRYILGNGDRNVYAGLLSLGHNPVHLLGLIPQQLTALQRERVPNSKAAESHEPIERVYLVSLLGVRYLPIAGIQELLVLGIRQRHGGRLVYLNFRQGGYPGEPLGLVAVAEERPEPLAYFCTRGGGWVGLFPRCAEIREQLAGDALHYIHGFTFTERSEPVEFSRVLREHTLRDTLDLLILDEAVCGILKVAALDFRRGLLGYAPRELVQNLLPLLFRLLPRACARTLAVLFAAVSPAEMFATSAAFARFVTAILTIRGMANEDCDNRGCAHGPTVASG